MDARLEMWSQWMRASGATDRTIDTRLGGIASLCSHAHVEDPVSLTTIQIVAWLADCRSAWTRYTYATTSRLWHRWLVEQGFRDDDPSKRVPVPPQPRGTPRPAASPALALTLGAAPRRARAYIALAAFEGLRVHEIAKVRGEDFQGDWLYGIGKGGHKWALPVHPVIDQLRRGFPTQGWWFPSGTSSTGHVLADSVSRSISQQFRRHGYAFTAHQLRHWFGTHTLRASRDLRVTQELMRHLSVSSTEIYTEVASHSKVEAVRRLAAS